MVQAAESGSTSAGLGPPLHFNGQVHRGTALRTLQSAHPGKQGTVTRAPAHTQWQPELRCVWSVSAAAGDASESRGVFFFYYFLIFFLAQDVQAVSYLSSEPPPC